MITDNRFSISVFVLAAVLAWTGCSNAPTPPAAGTKTVADAKSETAKEAVKPPTLVSAQTAFYEMYKPARAWAVDLLPLSLSAKDVPSVKSEGGKAPLWTAVFVSPARREARTFFYSAVDDGEFAHHGVSAGGAQPWSGYTPESRPFQTTELVVQSDLIYRTAADKAADWLKSHPDQKAPTMLLGSSAKFPQAVWLVMWGTPKNGFAVYINATTGIVLK